MLTQEALYPPSHLSSWVFGVVVPESVYCRLAVRKKSYYPQTFACYKAWRPLGSLGKKIKEHANSFLGHARH